MMRIQACVYASQEGRVLWDIFISLSDFSWEDVQRQAKAWKLKGKGGGRGKVESADSKPSKPRITAAMVAERLQRNLNADGECRLNDDEKWGGHCLTAADVKHLVGEALGMKNPRYVRPLIYEAWRRGIISDKKVESIPGYTTEGKVQGASWEPIPIDATLWACGVLTPHVDGAPAKLIVKKEDVEAAYPAFKELAENGGIPVDLDHILTDHNKTLLRDALALREVALITDVKLMDGEIRATEIQPTHEAFYALLDSGHVKAFSVTMDAGLIEEGNGVYRFKDLGRLESVSLVERPGCPTCVVHSIEAARADDGGGGRHVLIQFGGEKVSETNEQDNTALDVDALAEKFAEKLSEKLEGIVRDALAEALQSTEEDTQNEIEASSPPATEDTGIAHLKEEVAEMKERLKEAEAKKLVESYAEEGKILPKDIEKHVRIALSAPEEYKELMSEAPVLIEMGRKSTPGAPMAEEKRPSYQEFLQELERLRGGAQ